MSFVALFATEDVSVSTPRRVLSPEDLQTLQEARDLVLALQKQREEAEARQIAAIDKARREGYAAGFAAGEVASRGQLAQAQLHLAEASQRERRMLRQQTEATVATLALEVVRKMAGELDAADLVAALAKTAVQQLIEDEPVTLVVHPRLAPRVRERCLRGQGDAVRAPGRSQAGPHPLGGSADVPADRGAGISARWPVVEVQEDPTLKPFDCRLVTRAGTTLAGLDAQLRRLEAVWGIVEAAR